MAEEHSCVQENTIGRLEATIEQIGKTLDKVSTALETIAAHSIRVEKLEKDTDEIFVRLRVVELGHNSAATKIGLFSGIISAIVALVTALIAKFFGGHLT